MIVTVEIPPIVFEVIGEIGAAAALYVIPNLVVALVVTLMFSIEMHERYEFDEVTLADAAKCIGLMSFLLIPVGSYIWLETKYQEYQVNKWLKHKRNEVMQRCRNKKQK